VANYRYLGLVIAFLVKAGASLAPYNLIISSLIISLMTAHSINWRLNLCFLTFISGMRIPCTWSTCYPIILTLVFPFTTS